MNFHILVNYITCAWLIRQDDYPRLRCLLWQSRDSPKFRGFLEALPWRDASLLRLTYFGFDTAGDTGDISIAPQSRATLSPKTFMCIYLFTDDLFRLSPFLNNGSRNKQLRSIKDALPDEFILQFFFSLPPPPSSNTSHLLFGCSRAVREYNRLTHNSFFDVILYGSRKGRNETDEVLCCHLAPDTAIS